MPTVATSRPAVKSGRERQPAATPATPAAPAVPAPPVAARGQIVTGCGLADIFNEAAVFTITKADGTQQLYWLGAVTDGGRIVGLTLRQFRTGKLYHVTFDPETQAFACDCPDATYRDREGGCKHIVALHDALCCHGGDDAHGRGPRGE